MSGARDEDQPPTYASYLAIDELLGLQVPRSDPVEHDELLFIVIHQVYELWFKVLLHELDRAKRSLSADRLFEAIHTFKRARTILKTLVGQIDILETMTPLSFSAFRSRLETASGFQSAQFREVEFVLGHKREAVLAELVRHPAGHARVRQRLAERSLVDHFYDFLAAHGVAIPEPLRAKPVEEPNVPDATIQRGLVGLYRTSPDVAILLELMTDFDEGLQEWRYRHVMLVERTIGTKRGTGGSPGAEFLRRTLFQPVFPDLWAIRHEL
jgi:tryptophan 2,3-dioxygenase